MSESQCTEVYDPVPEPLQAFLAGIEDIDRMILMAIAEGNTHAQIGIDMELAGQTVTNRMHKLRAACLGNGCADYDIYSLATLCHELAERAK